jgi:hypothetical protein
MVESEAILLLGVVAIDVAAVDFLKLGVGVLLEKTHVELELLLLDVLLRNLEKARLVHAALGMVKEQFAYYIFDKPILCPLANSRAKCLVVDLALKPILYSTLLLTYLPNNQPTLLPPWKMSKPLSSEPSNFFMLICEHT